MKNRAFGKTGFQASEIGLGTWQLGADWGAVPEPTKILEAALESGITFFDTADVYGAGKSEELVGRISQNRDDLFIATKAGRSKGYPDDYRYNLIRRCAEHSRERLRADTLDLLQLHCVPTHWLKEDRIFDWMRQLQSEGVVKHWGASVESMEEAELCLAQEGCASLQIIFNVFRQKPRDTIFEQAKEKGVALIVRLPLASGLLTGKFGADSTFGEDDHRNYNRDGACFNVGETFAGLPFETGLELVEELRGIRGDALADATLAQFSLRWILDHEAVSVVIPGASKVDQVKSNAEVSAIAGLSPELHQGLADWYQARVADGIRGPY